MMYRTTSYAENVWDVFWYEKNLQGDIIAVYNSAGTKVATYTYTDAWGNHSVSYSNGGASTGVVYNPFRYRSYYYDKDLGMYYLQSRYYDANICRFINADSALYHSMLGYNMFAYCENNPVNYIDTTGESAEAVSEAAKYFWWLIFVDGALPIGDVIFFVVMGTVIIIEVSEIIRLAAENVSNNDADDVPNSLTDPEDSSTDSETPNVKYPGNDPTVAPDGYEWAGPDPQGGKRGGYKNRDQNQKDSWHPDLNHPGDIKPHWDYNDGFGHKWRVFPDGIEFVK